MDPHWREEALRQLGEPSYNVTVDLFAREGNAARPLYIDRKRDAFAYDWSRLQGAAEHVLWANPPFVLLGRVVAKLCTDPCRVALCCPVMPQAKWWPALQKLTVEQVELPEGERLYHGCIKKGLLPPPKWKSVVCLIDSTGDRRPVPTKKYSRWLAAQSRGLDLQALWDSHFPPHGGGGVFPPAKSPWGDPSQSSTHISRPLIERDSRAMAPPPSTEAAGENPGALQGTAENPQPVHTGGGAAPRSRRRKTGSPFTKAQRGKGYRGPRGAPKKRRARPPLATGARGGG